jgi:hypothetical protein
MSSHPGHIYSAVNKYCKGTLPKSAEKGTHTKYCTVYAYSTQICTLRMIYGVMKVFSCNSKTYFVMEDRKV